jgi:uncharacterized protein (TIRG00374 family)
MWSLLRSVSRVPAIPAVARHIVTGPQVGALMVGGSLVVASIFLADHFGVANVLTAIGQANIGLLALAVGLGVVVQIVRAQRARCMLAQERAIKFGDSYAAMVVGHGIGDLLPLAPGGPALRCVLTERLSGVPMPFSAGAFMLEGLFDGLSPALLIPYLLVVLPLPGWIRWTLLAVVVQLGLFLVAGLLVKILSRGRRWRGVGSSPLGAVVRLGTQVGGGLMAAIRRGPRSVFSIAGLSLLVTGIGALQFALFLNAFGLTASVNDLLFVLVVTLAAGSIPLKIPGAGTITTTGAMGVAAIHGTGLAGYVLISRVVFSSETAVLALALLGWWGVTGRYRRIGVRDLLWNGRYRSAVPGLLSPSQAPTESGAPEAA